MTMDAFDAKGASIYSTDHDVHKACRLPLSPLFSKAKVASRQDLIRRNVDKLCERVSQTSEVIIVNLGAATSAFARDVATDLFSANLTTASTRRILMFT